MTEYEARTTLYTADELLKGFRPDEELGFTETHDFSVYRRFVRDGETAPFSTEVRLQQAAHDAGISGALAEYLSTAPPLVGVMGGHKLTRKEPAYLLVARLARHLTRKNFLIATGGGPGAMEAAHLGAMFAHADDAIMEQALEVIGEIPKLPLLKGPLFGDDGSVLPGQIRNLQDAHLWLKAALRAKNLCPPQHGESLAIPTWKYGQEPTTPFAAVYAKYFQNSIREEALVAKAKTGIIYARGGGGTIREIFQDVEENYYEERTSLFTPMIFFDPDGYWQNDVDIDPETGRNRRRQGIQLDGALSEIFKIARAGYGDTAQCLSKIRFTVDFDEIVRLLQSHRDAAQEKRALMLERHADRLSAAR
ncbi:LOG family protein [Streptomyces sp. NBC_01408]|uniref:LOG family protein n=1 Tax=Streptomyces sp. NBC_01408 TaxID=2903855 RepID=UPI00224ED193|nr:LOG family protein [Streptomyces sp. NBC_01408]MCX4696487.1 LOG family protein [Streptomyces sp. NBC_01408]